MKRVVSTLTMAALIWVTPVATVLAQHSADAAVEATAVTEPEGAAKPGAEAGAGLRADMLKLVADAKAGRVWRAPSPQQQPPAQSNGLSKGQKTALVVGVAAAVIILVIVASRKDADKFVAPPCPPGQLCQ